VCGNHVKEQRWITDGLGEILTVGLCCARPFAEAPGRRCYKCGVYHRYRQSNLCEDCHPKCGYCHREMTEGTLETICASCVRRGVRKCSPCSQLYMYLKVRYENEGLIPLCPDCTPGRCLDCGKVKKDPRYKVCYDCKQVRDRMANKCLDCDKPCGSFHKCWTCNHKKKATF
jgi:hypothetical protein